MLHCLLHCTFTTTFKSLRNQYHKLILSSKKRVLLQPRILSLQQPQTSLANSQQTPTPQVLLTDSHHFSWHFTCRQLCFFFSLAKYPNSAILSPATLPYHLCTHPLLLPLPLIFQSSPLPQNPKSTRSCPTVQTSNLT